MRSYLPSYLPCDTLSLVFCLRGWVREGVGHLGLHPGGTPPQPSRCQPVCGHLSSHTDPKIGAYDAPWRSACWKLSPWLQKSPSLDLLPAAKTWISCDTVIKIIKIHKTTKSPKKLRNWIHFRPLGRTFGRLGGRKASQSRPKSLPNPPETSLGAQGPFYPAPSPLYSASPGSQKRPTGLQKASNEDKVVQNTSP